MSAAFGWTVEDTEREVVALIQRGKSSAASTVRTKFYGRALRTTARSSMRMRSRLGLKCRALQISCCYAFSCARFHLF
jgi:hypothetical protein